jgi:AcrR family transcriptional regulator
VKRFTLLVNRQVGHGLGLRERQKQDRQQRILDAATLLFRNRGFEETHMEAIAEQAGLSVGALYNYYRSKGDLLAAIVAVEVSEVLKLGEAVVADPPEDVAEALDRLVSIYYEHSLVYLDKAMWREAIAITTRTPDAPSARVYIDLDGQLATQIASMLGAMKRTGRVAADIDESVAGSLVFNNLDRMFQDFVRSEKMSMQALCAAVSAQHRLITNAIAA